MYTVFIITVQLSSKNKPDYKIYHSVIKHILSTLNLKLPSVSTLLKSIHKTVVFNGCSNLIVTVLKCCIGELFADKIYNLCNMAAKFVILSFLADRTATQYDRLLA